MTRTTLLTAAVALLLTTVPLATPVGAHVSQWELRNADWDVAPDSDPGDFALRMSTHGGPYSDQGLLEGPFGSITLNLPDGTQLEDLHTLNAGYYAESVEDNEGDGACGVGSPRMQIAVDTDGDGASDGSIFAHRDASFGGCPAQEWVHHEFYDPPGRTWQANHVESSCKGPSGVTYMETSNAIDCISKNHPDHEILEVNLVWDSFWKFGAAETFYDDVSIQDHTLSEPVGTELWCPVTADGMQDACVT